MSIWGFVGLGLVTLVIVALLSNRATCRKAFVAGYNSQGKPESEILEAYKSYLAPMRPMDAAAFQRGLEYAAETPNLDVTGEQFTSAFKRIYKTGVFTREGTQIRHMGKDVGACQFQRILEHRPEIDAG
jgi:hypothetical protein